MSAVVGCCLGRVVRHSATFTQLGGTARAGGPVDLVWSPRDPLVVRLGFPGQRIVWALSRELMLDALVSSGRVGEGDVRWFPNPGVPGQLILELWGTGGCAGFQVEREVLVAFLAATIGQDCIDPFVELEAWLLGVAR